jgi:hypothetical protein
MNFAEEKIMFLIEVEVRAHVGGFRLVSLGCVSRATDLDYGQPSSEFFFMVEISTCPPHKISQKSRDIYT